MKSTVKGQLSSLVTWLGEISIHKQVHIDDCYIQTLYSFTKLKVINYEKNYQKKFLQGSLPTRHCKTELLVHKTLFTWEKKVHLFPHTIKTLLEYIITHTLKILCDVLASVEMLLTHYRYRSIRH